MLVILTILRKVWRSSAYKWISFYFCVIIIEILSCKCHLWIPWICRLLLCLSIKHNWGLIKWNHVTIPNDFDLRELIALVWNRKNRILILSWIISSGSTVAISRWITSIFYFSRRFSFVRLFMMISNNSFGVQKAFKSAISSLLKQIKVRLRPPITYIPRFVRAIWLFNWAQGDFGIRVGNIAWKHLRFFVVFLAEVGRRTFQTCYLVP